jgi:gamma-D-glutamyl-L-lysine dipeptidyl-peptidase
MPWLVITAVAPLRAEPSHRSEMISQMLFGELADELESRGDFVKIRGRYDGYEGWCQRRQLAKSTGEGYPFVTRFSRHPGDYVLVNGIKVQLSPGSICFVPDSAEALQIGPYALSFHLQAEPYNDNAEKGASAAVNFAKLFLGTPYLWGGRSRYGMDCSGLTQTSFKLAGKFLPRDSGPQSREGEVVNLLQEARAGDLAFFDNEEGKIVHVGILLSPSEIIHASASVRIDPIDSYGIMHREEGERTHRLRIIKRFF